VGAEPSTGNLPVGITAQTKSALEAIEAVLMASGLSLKHVVKTSVFLADITEFQQMNEEYAKHFSAPYPARTTVQVAALPKGARVEIDAIAVH
jgi:2-iminobutanoate/2-iminopropanoate deaminase